MSVKLIKKQLFSMPYYFRKFSEFFDGVLAENFAKKVLKNMFSDKVTTCKYLGWFEKLGD